MCPDKQTLIYGASDGCRKIPKCDLRLWEGRLSRVAKGVVHTLRKLCDLAVFWCSVLSRVKWVNSGLSSQGCWVTWNVCAMFLEPPRDWMNVSYLCVEFLISSFLIKRLCRCLLWLISKIIKQNEGLLTKKKKHVEFSSLIDIGYRFLCRALGNFWNL